MKSTLRFASTLGPLVCLAAPSRADILKVPSVNFPTIASAVAAASSGDTIQVAPNNAPGSGGVYTEEVIVPNTKTGLHFKAANVVWDGGVLNDPLVFLGPNDNVTVEGFVFRNGTLQLQIFGNNATVKNCEFYGVIVPFGRALTIYGDFASVSGVKVQNNFGNGVEIVGTDGLITKSTFASVGSTCIKLENADRTIVSACKLSKCNLGIFVWNSNDVQVVKSTIESCNYYGVNVKGARVLIEGSKILYSKYEAIRIEPGSDDAMIRGNTIDTCGAYGIHIDSAHATVSKNKITNVEGGIRIVNGNTAFVGGPTVTSNSVKTCRDGSGILVDADVVTIASNSVDRVIGEYQYGILVNALGGLLTQGGSVSKNKVTDANDAGLGLKVDGLSVTGNSVSATGTGGIDNVGIFILANNCTLVGNSVSDIAGDGYQLAGNGNTATDCEASHCSRDGFDVASGTGNTIDGCRATACGAEGLDNSTVAVNTSVRNSTFSKCRIDFAGNNDLAQDLNNKFTTGGASTIPLID